ncbi:MAG: hypothetical protein WBP81_14875, partial [Solirubrobacteraceae bacterium]
MSQEIAADTHPAIDYAPELGSDGSLQAAARRYLRSRTAPRFLPSRWRLAGVALMGAVAAAGVGYLTSINSRATPAGIAVTGRVLIIGTLIVTGVYAQTSRIQARMGGLLVAAGLWSSLWLSNGSSNPLAFSVGVLCTGLTPAVFSYLMLANPSGRLHSTTERRFLATAGGALTLLWVVAVLTSIQPPLATPLLRCAPHCPHNAFFIGSATAEVQSVLKAAIMLGWIAVVCGTPLLLAQRWRAASA